MSIHSKSPHSLQDLLLRGERLAGLGSWVWDRKTDRIVMSDQLVRLFQLRTRKRRLPRSLILDLLGPQETEKIRTVLNKAILAGKEAEVDFNFFGPDGVIRKFSAVIAHEVASDGTLVHAWGACLDITERSRENESRQKLQDQLIRAQRMESLGRLSAGVAHEFNNLMQIILLRSEQLRSKTNAAGDPIDDDFERLNHAIERGRSIARDLMVYARPRISSSKKFRFSNAVQEAMNLISPLFPRAVQLTVKEEAGVAEIEGNPDMISQLILNLALNARDAMPNGGHLTLETSLCKSSLLREPLRTQSPLSLVLCLRDTGHGMSPEVRTRIFEPFFSTKSDDRGYGLGLAVVSMIAQNHGARIEVESADGGPTSFYISFPAFTTEETLPAPAVSPIPLPPINPTETPQERPWIILAEDEDDIRRALERGLNRAGFVVLSAKNGAQALDLLIANPSRIALLVTDLWMPKLSGEDLIKRTRELLPALPIIAITGELKPKEHDASLLLHKPFRVSALVEQIQALLEIPSQAGLTTSNIHPIRSRPAIHAERH